MREEHLPKASAILVAYDRIPRERDHLSDRCWSEVITGFYVVATRRDEVALPY